MRIMEEGMGGSYSLGLFAGLELRERVEEQWIGIRKKEIEK